MTLSVATVTVGMLEVNCYVVWRGAGGPAVIIDPGADAEAVLHAVRARALRPAAVLLTHAHVDHIGGVPGIVAATDIPVFVHAADRELYADPDNALRPWLPPVGNLPEPVAAPPSVDGLDYTVVPAPGHTPGGACYYFPDDAALFAGDTLFQGSVGRTDLAGGDTAALMATLRERILTLPDATRVFPGHGPPTTVGAERATNPYLQ